MFTKAIVDTMTTILTAGAIRGIAPFHSVCSLSREITGGK